MNLIIIAIGNNGYIKLIYIIFLFTIVLLCSSLSFGAWKIEFIQKLIFNLTGESTSFIARGEIWSYYYSVLLNSPLIGFGYIRSGISAHNTFLQLTYYGGLVSISLLLVPIIDAFIRYKNDSEFEFVKITLIISFILLFFFEQNPFYPGLYFLLFYDHSKLAF
jgi:hypothetical protein